MPLGSPTRLTQPGQRKRLPEELRDDAIDVETAADLPAVIERHDLLRLVQLSRDHRRRVSRVVVTHEPNMLVALTDAATPAPGLQT
jgi:hypothetical protein